MRRRIYWLLPDLASARRTMSDLLLARIAEQHIHFVTPEGSDNAGLHPANVLQTSDVLRAAQAGLVIGGVAGGVVGTAVALFFPVFGDGTASAVDARQWGVAAVLSLFGGAIGAWASSMIGISTPSYRLRRFQGALEQGQILLMVDVPRSRVEEIEALLAASHPEARFEGEEPNIPAFP
ncbi:DUF1269 domain-containing protein [Caldimonas sp. KR1-144]|uniref:DUF1269 domain-containing protein n=1 Tax=Caldimonas sp. KR1-144 TaxID=3400911 RepID=UPI003C044284